MYLFFVYLNILIIKKNKIMAANQINTEIKKVKNAMDSLIKTHKKTKQRLLLKKGRGIVSTFYLLDENDNKIKDGLNVYGKPYYKVAVCRSKNIN